MLSTPSLKSFILHSLNFKVFSHEDLFVELHCGHYPAFFWRSHEAVLSIHWFWTWSQLFSTFVIFQQYWKSFGQVFEVLNILISYFILLLSHIIPWSLLCDFGFYSPPEYELCFSFLISVKLWLKILKAGLLRYFCIVILGFMSLV